MDTGMKTAKFMLPVTTNLMLYSRLHNVIQGKTILLVRLFFGARFNKKEAGLLEQSGACANKR